MQENNLIELYNECIEEKWSAVLHNVKHFDWNNHKPEERKRFFRLLTKTIRIPCVFCWEAYNRDSSELHNCEICLINKDLCDAHGYKGLYSKIFNKYLEMAKDEFNNKQLFNDFIKSVSSLNDSLKSELNKLEEVKK